MIGAILGGIQVGMGALQMVDAAHNAKMMKIAADFNASQLEHNARLLDFTKQDIFSKAEEDVKFREQLTSKMVGSQKTSFAGQNVNLDSDVVLQFEQEEYKYGVEDVAAIKNNAWRDAMGIEMQQHDLRTQAKFDRLSARSSARQTISTGVISGLGSMVGGAQKIRRG